MLKNETGKKIGMKLSTKINKAQYKSSIKQKRHYFLISIFYPTDSGNIFSVTKGRLYETDFAG